MEDYYTQLICEKGFNLELYKSLFEKEAWEEMFNLALSDDFLELVDFLYLEMGCKFYLNNYIQKMDQDLLHILNDDKGVNERGFRVMYKNQNNICFQHLLSMRKYSKLLRNEKGFYYIFSKK